MNNTIATNCPVNSHNEWDPLEEVIIGRLEHAMFPAWNVINNATAPPNEWQAAAAAIGGEGAPYPPEMVGAAQKALDNLIHILKAEGVVVRQPDLFDFSQPYATPAWQIPSGFCAANPRDQFMVVGNEIIETPMADRGRYFETWPYRSLFKNYFNAGAKWVSAPKPQLCDPLYDWNYTVPTKEEPMRYMVTEFEPVFDAADFVRCGRDIFCQLSNVTNRMGVEWLQRHLGSDYRLHILQNQSAEAIHIDTTFMPLAPGKVLVSPDYIHIDTLPPILNSWDILVAPEAVPHTTSLGMVSDWISINVLMLDEERIIVDQKQEPLIKALKGWGFKPIPIDYEAYYPFLGGIHCATLDIRRRGELQSYF